MHWYVGQYERARPIFDRERRDFHPIDELVEVIPGADAMDLVLASRGGKLLRARITFPDPEVVRLQWTHGGEPDDHLTEMLVGRPARLPLHVDEDEDGVTVSAGGTALVLRRQPWRLEFGPFATERSDGSLLEPVAEPGGWAVDRNTADHRVQAYETFVLRPGEQLWGMGERFTGPGLRGRRVAHFIDEPGGTNTTDRSYKSVPMVISSRGYGLFLHHGEEAVFDLGGTSTASGSVLVDAAELDLFVMLGDPKQVLGRYTALTGRAPVPPEWTFGTWLSKCMYESRAEVEESLETARELGITIDVIGLDPWWLANRPDMGYDFCDFEWNEKDFGPLDEFVGMLRGHAARLCLWVNPNVVEGTAAYQPGRLVSRGRVRESCFPTRAFVDFTGEGGDWWVSELERLHAAGVDAIKLDYGELVPVHSEFADGRSGRQLHNLYGLLASMTAHRAGIPFFYTRSGTAGSQRYPAHWPGDAQSTWAGMAGNLRGGLSAAWSGFAHWSTDIGGFFRRNYTPLDRTMDSYIDPVIELQLPEPELFIRWTQWAMFLSHNRFHGILGRQPWQFGDEAVEIVRDFLLLRRRLRPYLVRLSEEAAATGVPLVRPMALEFPNDPGARWIDTQFMLGPDLLVAPVLEPGGRVEVYVPDGTWIDHFTGAVYNGPRWIDPMTVPLDRTPVLVRAGAEPITPGADDD